MNNSTELFNNYNINIHSVRKNQFKLEQGKKLLKILVMDTITFVSLLDKADKRQNEDCITVPS